MGGALNHMSIDQHHMQILVRRALKDLFDKDGPLLERDAAERAIAAKLAVHLAVLFPDHKVDVEYNRHGLDRKRVELPPNCRYGGIKLILPDIVVHRRGTDDDNLLVVELKKQTNTKKESRDCDRAKIVAMKREFHYQHGVLIDLPVGVGVEEHQLREEWL
jgi:hypothetical protein